ncbi:MAG TPA: Clp protease N-terminal domain-containing protein [Actinophytocola sp.]|jgi:ATP-dependent Clp protease ATP-binding subunit ClpA|uniref:Clp protease N-terminal domain-containing protein n=1 Tax=Actinophytocola sp. TaxID=1872138 RepID=UPI002F9453A3
MFERFTKPARQIVTDAVGEAERERAPKVTGEHVMLALLGKQTRSAEVLSAAGVTREVLLDAFGTTRRRGGVTGAEADALRLLGIDVDAIVERVERTHGVNALADQRRDRAGHTPFADETKALLARTLRQAVDRRDRRISDEHVLLALAAGGGSTGEVLARHGLTYPEVRARLAS